jgi:hypothetical protein
MAKVNPFADNRAVLRGDWTFDGVGHHLSNHCKDLITGYAYLLMTPFECHCTLSE